MSSLSRKGERERERGRQGAKTGFSFSYLVDLVVILRVILVHLFLLLKFKRSVTKKKGRRSDFSSPTYHARTASVRTTHVVV
jgi:hypothetical protein